MDGRSVSFYLSDEEMQKLETLQKAYKSKSKSEMLRELVRMEYQNLSKYHNMLNSNYLADKQIITRHHSNRKLKNTVTF